MPKKIRVSQKKRDEEGEGKGHVYREGEAIPAASKVEMIIDPKREAEVKRTIRALQRKDV